MKQIKARRILSQVGNLCDIISVNTKQKATSKSALKHDRSDLKQAERRLKKLRNEPIVSLLPKDFSITTNVSALEFVLDKSHVLAVRTQDDLRNMAEAYRQRLETCESEISTFKHAREQAEGRLRVADERLTDARKGMRKLKKRAKKAVRVVIKRALAA